MQGLRLLLAQLVDAGGPGQAGQGLRLVLATAGKGSLRQQSVLRQHML